MELRDGLKAADIDILLVGRETLSIKPDAVSCDVADLHEALVADDGEALALTLNAIGAHRLLDDLEIDGLYQDWADQERARLDQNLVKGVLGRLDALQIRDDWLNVRALADAYLQRDPTDESVVAAAIRADMALGAPSQARRRFIGLQSALRREFGTEPSALVSEAFSVTDRPEPRVSQVTKPAVLPERARSQTLLAVLAFDNLSADREMDFFSDGISEEILQTLARTSDLKVIARSSSFQFRGREKVTATVAARLRATHLLDGSVRRSGDRVRITAALVDCASETTIWSGRFDRDLKDVFALQDEIAVAVATGLNLAFAGVRAGAKIDAEAHDFFLRARAISGAPPNAKACVGLLEAAVSRSPHFAPAWASLAMARAIDARWNADPDHYPEARRLAIKDAEHAINLNADAGLPLIAMSLLEPSGRFATRASYLGRAVAASPADPEVIKQAADFAGSVGRIKESYDLLARATEIDPLNQTIANNLGVALANRGCLKEAYHAFEVARTRWPDFDWLLLSPLLIAANLGDWATADPLITQAIAKGGRFKMALSTVDLLRAPAQVIRRRLLETCERQLKSVGSVELRVLLFMYAQGLKSESLDYLYRSDFDFRTEHQPEKVFLMDILFGITNAPMRKDRHFMQFCERFGLCDYWVQSERWPDCVDEVAPFYDLKAEARLRVLTSATASTLGPGARTAAGGAA